MATKRPRRKGEPPTEPVATPEPGKPVENITGNITTTPAAPKAAVDALPKPPTGPIQTMNPKGKPFGISWETINQYDRLIAAAAAEFRVPFARLKAPIPIESGGKPDAVQRNDVNGWSYGLGQVVPYGVRWKGHYQRVIEVAGLPANAARADVVNALYDPATNLRVCAFILRDFYDQHGSWDAASSAFFTGGPNWQGADSVNGTRGGDYKRSLDGLLNEIWTADRQTAGGEGGYTFGMPAWPKGFDRRIVAKPPSGNGWDALGARAAGMNCTVCHITDGHDDRDAIVQLFGPGGGRYYDALTDAVIDRRGLGYLMNDPWSSDPMEGSGRTPWASGPTDGLEGPGVAYVQAFGGHAVNRFGFSAEHCNKEGQQFTDAQMDLSAKVYGVVITRMRIPWDVWPRNPHANNLYVALLHRYMARKSCPGWVWDEREFHPEWIRAVALEAKLLQTGSGGVIDPPPEPPPPPDPETFTAFGLPREQIEHYFGTLRRFNQDGTVDELGFNPEGPLSLFWLERFGDVGIFPEAEEMRAFDSKMADGQEWFATFEGGYTAWLPIDNGRATWKWLDRNVEEGG